MHLVRPRISRLFASLSAAWMAFASQLFAAESGAVSTGITAVPEPNVVLSLVGGAAVLIALQRRRKW